MSRSSPVRLLAALAVAVVLFGCEAPSGSDGGAASAPSVVLSGEDIALNNRGVALMGYFDYPGARDVFAEVVERQPLWSDAAINLAIATLNRQSDGDEAAALALATDVLAREPGHLRAHFISGILKLNASLVDEAAAHFQYVHDADPSDAYAAYWLAQCIDHRDAQTALDLLKTTQKLDPYLRSAYYGAFQLQRQLGDRDAAKASLDVYTRLADNPRARLAKLEYTRMGVRAEALAVDLPGAESPPPAEGPLFDDPVSLARLSRLYADSSMSVADIQGDGILDLYVASASPDVPGAVFLGAEDELQRAPDHPLAQVTGVNATAWGDVNNDGTTDAYLCRNGGNELWLQDEQGRWSRARKAGVGDGKHDCADVALLDADHDGDLDILVANRDGPTQLYSNNLDGTFRALGNERGLDFGDRPARQVLATDLDNDRDADLIVIGAEPPHQVFWNDRLWAYRLDTAHTDFAAAAHVAAVAADINSDGRTDLVTLSDEGAVHVWSAEPNAALRPQSFGRIAYAGRGALAVTELDGDAAPEIVLHGADGVHVAELDAEQATAHRFSVDGDIGAVLAVVENPADGPALWATERDVDGIVLKRFAPGAGRGRFAAFAFSGKEEAADSMRSNRSGIGTRVALRTGSNWSLTDTFDHHSGPGQSLQPIALGLGDAARADYIALTWSDGVYQTELDLAAGQLHAISETQRQLSSCPVVFAYDGERYGFVSDVLGVGGIGFLIEPGNYAAPRPWEYFLLPEGALAANDAGRLSLKITEPMEEIAYLDQARLHVFDLDAGWSVVMDERMATGAPAVTGEALYYRRTQEPSAAFDGTKRSVLDELAKTDGVAVSPGALDARFIGRTRAPHVVTLEFAKPINTTQAELRPVLVADGWVEYPYSQTVFSAWQAGAGYVPPSLEARTADGRWHMVHPQFGYPAGMPRRMALPLDALPDNTVALRLSSTLQLYWDRMFVAYAEAPGAALTRREASLADALVSATGFPRRIAHAQRRPDYDYRERTALWDSRHLAGAYTKFGDARALVGALDNAFAIFGPGEEVQLDFSAPPAEAGTSRFYVLEVRGFAKDMDLYTNTGGTVAPLPRADVAQDDLRTREALHNKYNTRYEAGS